MKIYKFRPVASNGDFVFKDMVPTGEAGTNQVSWNAKTDGKRVADLIPSPLRYIVLSERAATALGGYFAHAEQLSATDPDGGVISWIKPKNFVGTDAQIDHLFLLYPTFSFYLATESFKQAWLGMGFTGASFEEVAELDDALFTAHGQKSVNEHL